MAALGSKDRSRDDDSASGLSSRNAFLYPSPNGYGFPLPRVPSKGRHRSEDWMSTSEGPQHFQIPTTLPGSHDAYARNLHSLPLSHGEVVSTIDAQQFTDDLPNQWSAHNSPEAMEQWISEAFQEPSGSPGTSNGSLPDHIDPADSGELRSGSADMNIHLSAGRSDIMDQFTLPETALFPSSPNYMDIQAYSELPCQDEDDASVSNETMRNGSALRPNHVIPMSASPSFNPYRISEDDAMYTSPLDLISPNMFESQVPRGQILSSVGISNPSFTWSADNGRPGSQVASEETLTGLTTNAADRNHVKYSASSTKSSPRASRKSMHQLNTRLHEDISGMYIRRNSDSAGHYDEYANSSNRRDTSPTDNTPREHPLYQKATVGPDGLYHCPWEGQDPSCNHKPEKLKCNYDKFVDSHLKPYRCKVTACENARFSSTACLLRHEREAHAMHGHGEKPFLCTYEGCDRGLPGNGFPRHWNLCDHMKRVHGREPTPPAGAKTSTRGTRKRKIDPAETSASKRTPVDNPGVKLEIPAAAPVQDWQDQFYDQREQLVTELQQLGDPRDAATIQKLHNACTHLKVMFDVSQRMNVTRTISRGSG